MMAVASLNIRLSLDVNGDEPATDSPETVGAGV
jgi:hypothetical protein